MAFPVFKTPFSGSSQYDVLEVESIMRKWLPFVLVLSLAVLISIQGGLLGEVNSIGSVNSIRSPSLKSATRPGALDSKKQVLPKKIPAVSNARTVPNLDPLINQLIRHADLNSSAMKIMPWVYTTTTETVVADYEAAVSALESADHCLQEAMRNVLSEHNSLEVDPYLARATLELDNAEFTILLLVEIAKLEL